MIAKIGKMMTKREDKSFSYEELAAMLKTSPETLETFEGTYKRQVLDSGNLPENLLQWNAATVKAMLDKKVPFTREIEALIDRIVGELTDGTRLYIYNEKRGGYYVNYRVQAKNDYWENDGESLTELIHKYRWYILKDALMQRGRDAVTDFIGTDISSSEFSRVLNETEMVMPDETFEKFWEKYI